MGASQTSIETAPRQAAAGRVPAALRRGAVTADLVSFLALPRRRRHPHGAYRRLRRLEPVHESPFGVWILSRHADVSAALRHPAMSVVEENADLDALMANPLTRVLERLFSSHHDPDRPPPGERRFHSVISQSMLFRDPPDHTRLRSLVGKAFTRSTVAAAEPRIAEIVDELLDGVAGRGSMELMHELAYPLPARVICELLGVPAADHELIARHAPALATRLDPDVMRTGAVERAAEAAIAELLEYLDGLVAERRKSPGTDLLSELIAAEDAGDRLSHDELLATIILLLLAGHETTANLLGTGLVALLADPPAMERLRRDPTLDATAVDELLRYDGPIQMSQRVTLEEVAIGGATIPARRMVILMVAGANRDPEVFDHPDRLVLDRDPNPHLAFSSGAHFCIGAALARAEARIALRAILERLTGLRLDGTPRWRPSFTIRGLSHLPLAWDRPPPRW
jgi:cytochrome P450